MSGTDKDKGYFKFPCDIFSDEAFDNLAHAERTVWLHIMCEVYKRFFGPARENFIVTSMREIATLRKTNRRSVKSALDKAVDEEWCQMERSGNGIRIEIAPDRIETWQSHATYKSKRKPKRKRGVTSKVDPRCTTSPESGPQMHHLDEVDPRCTTVDPRCTTVDPRCTTVVHTGSTSSEIPDKNQEDNPSLGVRSNKKKARARTRVANDVPEEEREPFLSEKTASKNDEEFDRKSMREFIEKLERDYNQKIIDDAIAGGGRKK
jgi:hypothetical protein